MDEEAVAAALNETNAAYTLIASQVVAHEGGLPLRDAQWGSCELLYWGITEKVGKEDGVNVGMADRLLQELADSRLAAERL